MLLNLHIQAKLTTAASLISLEDKVRPLKLFTHLDPIEFKLDHWYKSVLDGLEKKKNKVMNKAAELRRYYQHKGQKLTGD